MLESQRSGCSIITIDEIALNLETEAMTLAEHKENVKEKLNITMDQILDEELEIFKGSTNFEFKAYMYGFYAFTFAKWFDPLLYRTAKHLLRKCKQHSIDG